MDGALSVLVYSHDIFFYVIKVFVVSCSCILLTVRVYIHTFHSNHKRRLLGLA